MLILKLSINFITIPKIQENLSILKNKEEKHEGLI